MASVMASLRAYRATGPRGSGVTRLRGYGPRGGQGDQSRWIETLLGGAALAAHLFEGLALVLDVLHHAVAKVLQCGKLAEGERLG